ncbi:AraC family transcriptional regulator [Paraburkholderia graminis]|uniref:AraC family transcriptional regulator n=1 Tax=Paraburkholderia graminis TaxID=60548 RepID=UPI00278E9203|nr:AraC family transcriptional regulator [Paraburkholderia graminis]MDQ0625970.1 AraC-like DNA-binding protein [Paraburkholderia graminis]
MTEPYLFEAKCPPEFDDCLQSGGAAAWAYRRAPTRCALEIAYWEGPRAPDGKTHFHNEAQMVFVLSGRREFIVGSRLYVVHAGQGLLIPAGHLHRSAPSGNWPTRCLNLYVPRSEVALLCKTMKISPDTRTEKDEISDLVQNSLMVLSDTNSKFRDVSTLAAAFGYSREAFSRKFSREAGIGPAEFSLLARLNRARALLQDGSAAALTALECGFADQSHMGRHFLRTFGVSPGQYARTRSVTNIPDGTVGGVRRFD